MDNLTIYRKRIRQFIDRVIDRRYGPPVQLEARYTYDRSPIPFGSLEKRRWKPIAPGTRWGELWGSGWFRFTGTVPAAFAGSEVCALVDTGSEGCLFVNGSPVQGLTDAPQVSGTLSRTPGYLRGKRRVPLFTRARGGEEVSLLIEVAANSLFGFKDRAEFVFRQAELAVLDRRMWQLGLDLEFLYQLADSLPPAAPRTKKLWRGLNDAANAWADGAGSDACRAICAGLYKQKADASSSSVWAVGHAHIDLGWLWPVRETRRKAGRTFSTALRLLEEYPDYVFGASQPQAYRWVKEDYPELYARIRKAVAGGRWECQGAMWVEPDMNITGGESLVRQLIFGKRFFREEFGVDVDNLWLPDVFGYSAALPQLLKQAGVDYFVTQKISWNETNTFPHHTFYWEGIDGTRILSHFLPTNTYNANNDPAELIHAEERFAQGDVSSDWLQVYGIGDGGGGPARRHVEFARRAANTEGVPRVRMASAREFLHRIARIPAARLPVWTGELYLELHRGTYTTQSRMKRYNRLLEGALHDTELLAVMAGLDQREPIAAAWRDVLLNQFHDILPGSSIRQVYEDAHEESERHLRSLDALRDRSLDALFGMPSAKANRFAVVNTLSWDRRSLVQLPWKGASAPRVTDAEGTPLPVQVVDGGVLVPVAAPSLGYTTLAVDPAATPESARASGAAVVKADGATLENDRVRVRLRKDGTIGSLYDKVERREVLAGPANRFLLWEDYPYSWDAWDISHYYRETVPEQAVLASRSVALSGPLRCTVHQRFTVGVSTIDQWIELDAGSPLVRIRNRVEWKESHKQLRVEARPAVSAPDASYEIQFGAVKRPAHANSSWDQAQFEVAAQRFADLSGPDYGLGLVNDCKYGHSARDGAMDLTLLRSPKDPDATADMGEHEFTFGYYPHAGCWESSDLLERAHELNAPLLVRAAGRLTGNPVHSEYRIEGGRVKLETVKQSEDGKAVVLRLYEPLGTAQSIVVRGRRPWKRLSEVNLLEEKVGSLPGKGAEAALTFTPFQIRTLYVEY